MRRSARGGRRAAVRRSASAACLGVPPTVLAAILVVGASLPMLAGASSASGVSSGPSGTTLGALAGTVVPIIPASSAFAVSGSPQDPEPAPVAIGHAFVYPDLYNTAAGQGNATLLQSGPDAALSTTIEFTNVSGRTPGVVGYPELQYGAKPWCARGSCPSPPTDSALALPEPVRALPDVTAVVDYAVATGAGTMGGPFDLAYDLWMTRSPNATSASNGDLELMVWLDYQNPAILPGSPVSTLTIPTLSGERWTPLPWQLYLQDGAGGSATDHWTVAYLILDPPAMSGTIGTDLTGMIRSVDVALAGEYPGTWSSSGMAGVADPSALYLDDIELGSEFRPLASAGPADQDWSLSSYCYRVAPPTGPAVAPALGANCSVVASVPASSVGFGPSPSMAIGATVVGSVGIALMIGQRSLRYRRSD